MCSIYIFTKPSSTSKLWFKQLLKAPQQWVPNPPILWGLTYNAYPPPFFSKFVHPPLQLPYHLQAPSSTPTALFVTLFLWLNGWLCSIWCVILLNDIVDIHMLSLGTSIPEGTCCVFYATRHQSHWGLTHNAFFAVTLIWFHTHTHTHTYTHRAHSMANRLTHLYKYTLTPPVICSKKLFVLHYMNNSLISKIYLPQCLFFSKINHL